MNTEIRHNYYEILDLSENASPHEIQLAYENAKATYSADNKALAQMFSAEEATALRELIEEAYQSLKQQNYQSLYQARMQANVVEVEKEEVIAAPVLEEKISEPLFIKAEPPTVFAAPVIENELAFAEEILTTPAIYKNTPSPVEEVFAAPVVDPTFESFIAGKREWTGDDLKQVREYRKLSFDELTDITKINPWYIAALEKMDPANLPVEVFVRGYVLQVAKALGLKEKMVADSYMRLFRKKIEN